MPRLSDQMPRQMIAALSVNWLGVMVVFIIVMLMPTIINRHFMPFAIALISIAIAHFFGHNKPVIARCAVNSLWITAAIMVIINLLNFFGWLNYHVENPDIPYITGLILFTATAIVATFIYLRHHRIRWPIHALFKLCSDEEHLQVFILAAISAFLAVAQWLYYYHIYINVNFNNRDWLLFNLLPLTICVVSIPAMLARYFRINKALSAVYIGAKNRSIARIFVIADNRTILHLDKFGCWDTPFSFTAQKPDKKAVIDYIRANGFEPVDSRYLFSGITCDYLSPIDLWVVFVDIIPPEYCSFSLPDILGPLSRKVSIEMAFEITVVKVIASTCRMFHIDGTPRYDTQQFHPHFCLNDLRMPDIDYTDSRWIEIARRYNRRFARRIYNSFFNIFHLNRV